MQSVHLMPTRTTSNTLPKILLTLLILVILTQCTSRNLQFQQLQENQAQQQEDQTSQLDKQNIASQKITEFQLQKQDNDAENEQDQKWSNFPRVNGYLSQFSVGTSWDQDQNDISYDNFVDKYRNSDIRWKDPEIMFYKAEVLQQNILRIKKHNSLPGITYILGVNQYADMTLQQFRKRYMSEQPTDPITSVKSMQKIKADIIISQNFTIDWQCYDSPILLQGECDAGYAFSVLSSIQTTMRMHEIDIAPLSVQQIISCGSQQYQNQIKGCNGGYIKAVYQYAKQKGVGPMSMYDIQQQSVLNGKSTECEAAVVSNPNYVVRKRSIQSFERVAKGDCSELIYRLRFRALAVCVDSSQFTFYKEGVIHMNNSNKPIQLDHGVMLVGYDPEMQHYKIKNSWGPNWGIKGYAFVTNSVGICQQAYYPILKNQKILPKLC